MKNRSKVFLPIILLLILSLTLLAGCGGNKDSGDAGNNSEQTLKQETLKIGVIAPLSGAGAPWGVGLKRGVEMAATEINERGGLKIGDTQYTLEIVPYDDKYTGEGAVAAATRLVSQDNVKFIVGPISSAAVLAIQPITEAAGVLLMANSYSDVVLNPDNPLTLRAVMTSNETYVPFLSWLKENKPEIKKIAFLNPNDASGEAVSRAGLRALEKVKYDLVANEFYERGTTDFYPLLTKMLATNPDLIDGAGTPPGEFGIFVKQARELGYKGEFMIIAGLDAKTINDIAGPAGEGIYYALAPSDLQGNPKPAEKVKKYGELWPGEAYNPTTLAFYDPARIMMEAMEKAQSIEPEKVRDAILNNKWENVYGPVKFGNKALYGVPYQIIGQSYIAQLIDGKESLVATIDVSKLID
ncbi:MAG: ABC transporter substrate-binding protein [Bacillota bacterium]